MKKKLIITLVILLSFVTLGFPNQSAAEEPTTTPSIIVLPEQITIESTIEAGEIIGPGFEMSLNLPDTDETMDIILTIEKAYDIEAEAAFTFDFSKFSTVFINDLRFPVSPDTLETVRQLTLNPSLESAGWLDYKMAYNIWRRDSTLYYEAVQATAVAENRELTEEEIKSLSDPWGRSAPVRSESPIRNIAITYLTMEVKEDIAIVTLHRGIYYSQLTLVLLNNQWFIANEYFLSVSP